MLFLIQIALHTINIFSEDYKHYSMMKSFIVCVIALLFVYTQQQSLSTIKREAEKRVLNLARSMGEIYKQRCSDKYLSCQKKAYNGCEGTSQRTCFDDITQDDDCFTGGAKLGEEPVISFPPNKNEGNINQEDIQFICTSAGIDKQFKEAAQYPHKWAYIASQNGLTKVYPGIQIQCKDYDPRFRPWYVAATTGRKNVILVMDISGSMNEGVPQPKIRMAKAAAENVLNTLGPADTFALVVFSDNARSIGFGNIVQATQKNKQRMINALPSISANGGTSFYSAFQRVFDLLDDAQRSQSGANLCPQTENIILFLTDGKPSDKNKTVDDLTNLIDQRTIDHPISLFTYGLGGNGSDETVNQTLLRQLSCRYNGISFQIRRGSSSSQLVDIMRQYYIFLSHGTTLQNPIWTQPYTDAFIEQQIISVVYPIYYQQEDSPGIRILLGVAATDIPMEYLQEFGVTTSNALDKFINNYQCTNITFDECELENLRNSYSQSAVCNTSRNCSQVGTISSLCNVSYTDRSKVFADIQDDSDNLCCGLKKGQAIGIIIGSILGCCLCLIISFCCWRRHCKRKQKTEEQNQKNANNPPQTDERLRYNQNQENYNNPYQRKEPSFALTDSNVRNQNVNPYGIYETSKS